MSIFPLVTIDYRLELETFRPYQPRNLNRPVLSHILVVLLNRSVVSSNSEIVDNDFRNDINPRFPSDDSMTAIYESHGQQSLQFSPSPVNIYGGIEYGYS